MIVLDSSFRIAFHSERDAHHPAASILMGRSLNGEWGRGLLLDYVFLEVATVLLLGGHPKPANDGHLKTGQRE